MGRCAKARAPNKKRARNVKQGDASSCLPSSALVLLSHIILLLCDTIAEFYRRRGPSRRPSVNRPAAAADRAGLPCCFPADAPIFSVILRLLYIKQSALRWARLYNIIIK